MTAAPERGGGLGIAALCLTLVGALVFVAAVVIYFVAAGAGGLTWAEATLVCRIGIIAGLVIDLMGIIAGIAAITSHRGTSFGAAAIGFGGGVLILLGGGLLAFGLSAG